MDAGNLSRPVQELLQKKGFLLVGLRECKSDEDFSSFSQALSCVVDINPRGPFVEKRSVSDLKDSGARPFLAHNGMAGVAVWPDGNIGAAFKNCRLPGKAIGELMLTALSIGGNKLDCYDGFLPKAYTQFGFIPVARVKFNREFAPDNWDVKKFEEPDVVFMMHCGDPVETVVKKINVYPFIDLTHLPYFDTYEEAYQYRDVQQVAIM